jgi:GNAT superfamily N-acetyltransferase
MKIEARATSLADIQGLRDIYRHEMQCQIMGDSFHERRGWTRPYLVTVDGAPAGHGAVAIGGPWKENPTIFEFFVLPAQRRQTFGLFRAFVDAAGTRRIETQTNRALLAILAQSFCDHLTAEAILYEDGFTTSLQAPGVRFRPATRHDRAAIEAAKLDEGAMWVLELDGGVVASGGILYHYNRPYGDIYMAVAETHRRRGLGAYIVQELKRACYEGGSVPAARCNVDNVPSRATLQKAGFVPCGNRVFGTLSEMFMASRT